ncbi:GntR family transcriptional regulator [Microvirga terrae]|uniref:GntR family transcriptional regulator n=1 Tax=Microvirga terrae TaxID=2740529 RepID=A0ABY5RMD0_9HYPH|nr:MULTISPECIES: GntR family transcriptional regulator [Microvirga]MBQ0819034.1 GntR family transcriptional regulator [Microvirga sp. HBU67558]UVF17509.1 GntR family transcriptional regulator [Microvirga terrae]
MSIEKPGDRSLSQTVKAQLALRELVLRGALNPGERVSELQMVERLGVSRTPVRMALVRLEEEGLLEAIPSGGFAVKAFSEKEVFISIEIRGTLEGLAARLAAEHGVGRSELVEAASCLDDIDEVIRRDMLEIDLSQYVELNARFHRILIDMADSPPLARQIERASALPFASASALVPVQSRSPELHHILTVAQDQHRCVLTAIERREGSRAEAIMREHARIAHRNLERALTNQRDMDLVPGSALIKRRVRA